jgi:hypothetical protein
VYKLWYESSWTHHDDGEEKLVYNPKGIALIKRKKLDYLFKKSGQEAYLNDEVTIQ